MVAALVIFVATFAWAFLGCLQAINVVERRRVWAFFTSIAIAVAHLCLYKTVPATNDVWGVSAFVVAGVLGSQLSIVVTLRRGGTR